MRYVCGLGSKNRVWRLGRLYLTSATALGYLKSCLTLLGLSFLICKKVQGCTPQRSSLVAQTVKLCLQCGRPGFDSWVGKIPWRRKWQPTPALLPGKSHGRRSLIGYSPWGRKELDTTERLHFHTSKGCGGGDTR